MAPGFYQRFHPEEESRLQRWRVKSTPRSCFFPLFLAPAAPHTAHFLPFCPVWSVIQGWEPEVGCVFDPDWPFYYLSLERERRWLRMLNVYFDSVFPSTWRLFSHARHLFDGRCNIKGKGSGGSSGGGLGIFQIPSRLRNCPRRRWVLHGLHLQSLVHIRVKISVTANKSGSTPLRWIIKSRPQHLCWGCCSKKMDLERNLIWFTSKMENQSFVLFMKVFTFVFCASSNWF